MMRRLWLSLLVRPKDMYNGERWRHLALAIKERDGWRCRYRTLGGWGPRCDNRHSLAVHHRWPWRRALRRWGWLGFRIANLSPMLITVCNRHHEKIHRRDLNHDGKIGA